MPEEQNSGELLKRVAELEEEVKTLEKDLIHDSLTGLRTRAFFEEEIKIYLELIKNADVGKRRAWFGFKNLSILFFDIDHFKSINDMYGHSVGDSVLKAVAKTVQGELRQGDTAARWGGEEMVVSLLGAISEDAVKKAKNILQKIRELSFPAWPDLKVTASIGVASAKLELSFEDLVKRADECMYRAKKSGRNKVVAYS